jgi:hypothetical protein
MAEQCFKNVDPNSPICGVHYVPLVYEQVPIDQFDPNIGKVICFRCPISRDVVQDGPGFWIQNLS